MGIIYMDTDNSVRLSSQLQSIPLFSTCDKRAIARLMPFIREQSLEAGDVLFAAGTRADTLFYVVSGKIKLTRGKRLNDIVSKGFVGEETVSEAENYMTTASAEEATTVMVFAAAGIADLLLDNPQVRTGLYHSLINHSANIEAFKARETTGKGAASKGGSGAFIGWLLATVVPIAVYFLSANSQLSDSSVYFLMIFAAAGVMWVFRLLPEYVPAIFIIMAVLVLGLVPKQVVLSGYSSESFFMALSVFGIGSVLVQSGLIYRFALLILRIIPPSGLFYSLALLFIGILLTPLLPSANGRVALVAPMLSDFVDVLGYRKKGKAASLMAAAAFTGLSIFSAVFLTSKPINFVLYGLFPNQVKDQFTWGYWFYASAAASAIMLAGYLLLSAVFFHSDEKPKVSKGLINAQMHILGAWTLHEWIALLAIVFFIVGVITSSVHKIQPGWIGLATLYFLLALGAISKNSFRKDVDWPFLLMLGGFVGLVKSMSFLEIDQWIADQLLWMGKFMANDFYIFILLLGIGIYLIRIVVPNSAAAVLVASIFMPIAIAQGINPWVIVFIVLMFSDGWLLPYQCSYYTMFTDIAGPKGVYEDKSFLNFNIMTNVLRFAAVYASIPFWRFLGLL